MNNKLQSIIQSSDDADSASNFSDSRYINLNLLRTDNELFKEEDNTVEKTINVKRVPLPRKGEDWEIFENNKIVLTLKGTRFTKSEKEFLRTVDGMKFLMDGYKTGVKSVAKFKQAIKKIKL